MIERSVARHDLASGELKQVATSLSEYNIDGHLLIEHCEVGSEFVCIHFFIQDSLTVHCHYGYAHEQLEGVSFIVGPDSFPDCEVVVLFEFSFQTDEKPAVREREEQTIRNRGTGRYGAREAVAS